MAPPSALSPDLPDKKPVLLAFAAYNAGPATCGHSAKANQMNLDPDRGFDQRAAAVEAGEEIVFAAVEWSGEVVAGAVGGGCDVGP